MNNAQKKSFEWYKIIREENRLISSIFRNVINIWQLILLLIEIGKECYAYLAVIDNLIYVNLEKRNRDSNILD